MTQYKISLHSSKDGERGEGEDKALTFVEPLHASEILQERYHMLSYLMFTILTLSHFRKEEIEAQAHNL